MVRWFDSLKGTNQVAAGTGACTGDQCANISFHGLENFTTSGVRSIIHYPIRTGKTRRSRRGGRVVLNPAALAKFAEEGGRCFREASVRRWKARQGPNSPPAGRFHHAFGIRAASRIPGE